MKQCFKCLETKELSEFYKHKKMPDGRFNKCKNCAKNDSKNDFYRKAKNEDFVLKERERSKEKYHRLKYKLKPKDKIKKPWLTNPKYNNLHRKFKILKGFELHHWNYKDEFIEDFFVLKTKEHRKAHTFLLLDSELLIFKTISGELLDSKPKHLNYLLSNGINF